MYSVYILYSGLLSKYYIGQTSDFAARLLQHNTGESTYTSKGIPWEAILVIEVASRKDAIILEKKLKNLSGKRLIDFITRHSKKE
jgi:putative endonuclease